MAVNFFLKEHNPVMSLSTIGSITRGHPENFKYWSDFLSRKEYIDGDPEDKDLNSWKLLSLDGVNYYFPLVLKKNTRLKFFSVFNDVEYNLISTDSLNEVLIHVPENQKKKTINFNDRILSVYPVVFKDISIAGRTVGEIQFFTCESCPNIVGKNFLDKYNLEYWSNNQIYYLQISSSQPIK